MYHSTNADEQGSARIADRPKMNSLDFAELSRDSEFEPPNRGQPTHARPGSMEKLTVMAERYSQGQQLHHPDDVSWLGLLMPGNTRPPPFTLPAK